jgi:RNA polymerase sigma-70 factor (ECF subfamily)
MLIESREVIKDKKPFKSFFNEVYPPLVVFAKRFVDSEDVAEDICQESMVVVWEKWTEIKKEEDARFFLYGIVRNKCLNYLKHLRVEDDYIKKMKVENPVWFENNVLEQEVFIMLRKAINQLAPQSKEIMNLSLLGMGNKEISDELDISVNTIKTLKRRAFKNLNEKLKEHFYMFFL